MYLKLIRAYKYINSPMEFSLLPDEVITYCILIELPFIDLMTYLVVDKKAFSWRSSKLFWNRYLGAQDRCQLQSIVVKISLAGANLFQLFEIIVTTSIDHLDIITLHQTLVTFGQLKFSSGVDLIRSLIGLLSSHPNFHFHEPLDIGVDLTERAIETIKKIGLDYEYFLSHQHRPTFRPRNDHLTELMVIDNGYNPRYSHSFFSRMSIFAMHLIPVIDRLQLHDYLWLFDHQSVLSEEDSDCEQDSSEEPRPIQDVPTRYNQYVSSTLMEIAASVVAALSAHNKKYQSELTRCLSIVKSERVKVICILKTLQFCRYPTFQILEGYLLGCDNSHFRYGRYIIGERSIMDWFLKFPDKIRPNEFLLYGAPAFPPESWVALSLEILTQQNIYQWHETIEKKIDFLLGWIYGKGYTRWVDEVVEILNHHPGYDFNITEVRYNGYQEFAYHSGNYTHTL